MAQTPHSEPLETAPEASIAPSDRSLLRRFRLGNDDAATALYLRYAKRLRALASKQFSADLASRVDPEDIVQSVFRTFFRRAARGEYSVPGGDELWKLFLVIALNKIRAAGAFHRAAKRDVRLTSGSQWLERSGTAGDAEQALTTLQIVVDELLGQLPVSHRAIVELRVEGHEVAAIAEQTGRAKRSVERVLQEFRKMLARLVEQSD